MTHLHTPYIKPSPPSSPCVLAQTVGFAEIVQDPDGDIRLDKVNPTQAQDGFDILRQQMTNFYLGILDILGSSDLSNFIFFGKQQLCTAINKFVSLMLHSLFLFPEIKFFINASKYFQV